MWSANALSLHYLALGPGASTDTHITDWGIRAGGSSSVLASSDLAVHSRIHTQEARALTTLVVHESGGSTLRKSVSESQAEPEELIVELK